MHEGTEVDDAVAPDPEVEPRSGRRRPSLDDLVLAGSWLVLVVPIVVALVAAARPQWYPLADRAQYELRVRDVGTVHTPLVGPSARIGPYYDPGNHPGPLTYWFLAPVYRLFGSSSWALLAASVSVHAAALGLLLALARRRAGLPLVALLTVVLAVLLRFYGANVLIEPWNPYLPLVWWLVFVLAVWAVVDGDVALVVPAVVAGSFCAQAHLAYLGLVGGLALLLVLPLVRAVRAGTTRERRWVGAGVLTGVVLWAPPVIDQVWGVGNLTRIQESITSPDPAMEPTVGFGRGAAELLRNLDVTAFWSGRDLNLVSDGRAATWPALVFLALWAATAILVWRGGQRSLSRLNLVLGVALLLSVVSVARVTGLLWRYLLPWAWGLAALVLAALAWNVVTLARQRVRPARLPAPRVLVASALAAALVVSGSFAVENRDASPEQMQHAEDLGAVVRQAVPVLDSGSVPGGGRTGRYLVRWTDRLLIGSQGFGMVDELEREGFHVGVDRGFGVAATTHRVLPEDEATAIIQVVTGPDIPAWDADPAATRIGFVDSRTDAERAEYDRLVDEVEGDLQAAGLDRQAEEWRGNLFTTSIDEDVPESIKATMREVLAIGGPVAVFVTEAGP